MMPIIGIKCDKFVTKSQAPTTPYGVPPLLCYSERETIPRKIILATSYYKNMENYGGLSDCEDLLAVKYKMMGLVLVLRHVQI